MSRLPAMWTTIAAIAVAGVIGLYASGRTLVPMGLVRFTVMLAALVGISIFYRRTRRSARIADAAEACGQLIAFTAAASILSYAVTATAAPALDAAFARADLAIGFEWARWTAAVRARPLLSRALFVAYESLLPQMIGLTLISGLFSRRRAEVFLWAVVVSGLITIVLSGFFPALGNDPEAPHAPHFIALRAGGLPHMDLADSYGLISFPSYHTVLAILLGWGARPQGHVRLRPVFAASCIVNGAMVVSVLSEGGHYLVDAIAGAAIAAVTIVLVERWDRGRPR
ncbi:MAG: phosphatase PAP2 family protein [Polyangiaceae bacterium]